MLKQNVYKSDNLFNTLHLIKNFRVTTPHPDLRLEIWKVERSNHIINISYEF